MKTQQPRASVISDINGYTDYLEPEHWHKPDFALSISVLELAKM